MEFRLVYIQDPWDIGCLASSRQLLTASGRPRLRIAAPGGEPRRLGGAVGSLKLQNIHTGEQNDQTGWVEFRLGTHGRFVS